MAQHENPFNSDPNAHSEDFRTWEQQLAGEAPDATGATHDNLETSAGEPSQLPNPSQLNAPEKLNTALSALDAITKSVHRLDTDHTLPLWVANNTITLGAARMAQASNDHYERKQAKLVLQEHANAAFERIVANNSRHSLDRPSTIDRNPAWRAQEKAALEAMPSLAESVKTFDTAIAEGTFKSNEDITNWMIDSSMGAVDETKNDPKKRGNLTDAQLVITTHALKAYKHLYQNNVKPAEEHENASATEQPATSSRPEREEQRKPQNNAELMHWLMLDLVQIVDTLGDPEKTQTAHKLVGAYLTQRASQRRSNIKQRTHRRPS